MKSKLQLMTTLTVAALVSVGRVSGQGAAVAAPVVPHWETTANAGLTATEGNSRTLLTTVGLDTKKKWDFDEAAFGISAGYGKNAHTRNTDYVKANGQYNRLLNERAFFGLNVQGEHDGTADLAYRLRVAPLAGYYLVKNETTSLEFDAGPALVHERRNDSGTPPAVTRAASHTYLGVRFGEKFEHKLSDTTKVWQTAEYIPVIKDWTEKYLINAEVGISSAITSKWGLRVVLQVNHDSNPPTGKKYTDARLIAGTDYKF